jgi:multiple sugar transport system substrate-binding protein
MRRNERVTSSDCRPVPSAVLHAWSANVSRSKSAKKRSPVTGATSATKSTAASASSVVTTANATTSDTVATAAASGGVKSTPATLVVSMWASSPEMDKIMSGQVSKYKTTNPGVTATPLTITGGPYDQKLLTMIAGGQAPDVIEINPDLFADYASRNVMHSLEPFMKVDKSFDINAYLPQQVAGFRWQGALGGLPIYNFTFVVYYNKDLFDKAGVAYPANNWTWDDYQVALQKLTTPSSAGKPGQFGGQVGFGWGNWIGRVWSNGGDLFDQGLTKYTLDQTAAVDALQWWADLRTKEKVIPMPADAGSLSAYDLFKAERIATYIWGTSMIPVIKDVKFKWDVAMIPAGKNGIWHRLGGACFCVSATTKQRDDAWNVTKWLVGEETQLAWVGTRLFAPTLLKVANSPQWADPSKAPANIKAFTDMTAHSRFIAVNYPAEAETNTALTSAFDAVWLGKQTAKTAAAAAAAPVQKLITTAASKRSSHLS